MTNSGCWKSKRSQRNEAAAALLVLSTFAVAAQSAERTQAAVRWTPRAIASDQYESTPTFTPDGREMYFMRSDPDFRRYSLLQSRCEKGAWTAPEPPSFAVPQPAFDADPFVTADGKRLYFISTRQNERDGDEDFDIWFVDRRADGSWSEAQRMPEPVNSSGSELLPRAVASGRLYFGSDRAGGHGQMDVYFAEKASGGKWTVTNVGPPVSTAASEYEPEVSHDERTMIVVADRGDRSHLYRFLRRGGAWIEQERIPARRDVFQVGPLLSPRADRLLFAEKDDQRSGEIYLFNLSAAPDESWPPNCDGS